MSRRLVKLLSLDDELARARSWEIPVAIEEHASYCQRSNRPPTGAVLAEIVRGVVPCPRFAAIVEAARRRRERE
jgi:hypothetical protein